MVGKRQQDNVDSEKHLRPRTDSLDAEMLRCNATVVKLQDIVSTLLGSIQYFVENSEKLDGEAFKIKLDENLVQLRKTVEVQKLTEIEESFKRLIFRQRESEKVYRQEQYTEFARIVETMVDGINEFTSDNSNFNDEFGLSLSRIDRIAELENLKQIRYQITQSVIKSKQVLHEKQIRDQENQAQLSKKIEALETQLSQAQEETLIDGLTQIANRRAFDERLAEEVRRSQMKEGGFGLVLFDVDHFKNLNDTHGHPVGDRILIALAKQAKEVFRIDDFVARYGGEEFAVILLAPALEIVSSASERLRKSIDQKRFRYQTEDEAKTLHVTISGGIAWCRDEDTPASLINRADQCLYLAKRSGRNQMKTELDLDALEAQDRR